MAKKRGAQKGNQNARKHGFYSGILTEKEKQRLHEADRIDGLDEEITLLRLKLRSLFEDHPDRIDMHMKAFFMLSRMIKTRYNLPVDDSKKFENAISKVMTEVAIPLGVTHIPMADGSNLYFKNEDSFPQHNDVI